MNENELISEAFSSYRFQKNSTLYSDKTISNFLSLYNEMNSGVYEKNSLERNKINNYFESREEAEIREIAEMIVYDEKIGEAIKGIAKKAISGLGRAAGSAVRLAGRAKEEFKKGYEAGRGTSGSNQNAGSGEQQPQRSQETNNPEQNMLGKVAQVKSQIDKIQKTGLMNTAEVKSILGNKSFQEAIKDFVSKPLLREKLGGRNPMLLKIAIASYLASIGVKGKDMSGGRNITGKVGDNFNLGSD